jgi:hypothetical protein
MVNYCLALPFLPGGPELAKRFMEENGTTREHDEFFKIAGITERTFGFSILHQGAVLQTLRLSVSRQMIQRKC